MKLDERAQQQFDVFNTMYFGESLPDVDIRCVKDLRHDGAKRCRLYGATSKVGDQFFIELDANLNGAQLKLTLMHEAVHVKLWPKSHRSREWKREVQRLAEAGFLLEVF